VEQKSSNVNPQWTRQVEVPPHFPEGARLRIPIAETGKPDDPRLITGENIVRLITADSLLVC